MSGNWLQSAHGRRINLPDFSSPDERCICFQETAWVLSGIQRFGARTTEAYTVAEHSMNVARLVWEWGGDALTQFVALNHEGDESLMGFDPPAPLLRECPDLRALKAQAHAAYFGHYRLNPVLPWLVKEADMYMLLWEKRDLMAPSIHPWDLTPEALGLELPARKLVPKYKRRSRLRDEFAHEWKRLAHEVGVPEEVW